MRNQLVTRYCLFLISAFACFTASAQQIHSPDQLLKIMKDSKLVYEFSEFTGTKECKNRNEDLNYHGFYREVSESGTIYTREFSAGEQAKKKIAQAETFFKQNQYDSALANYKAALAIDSTLYNAMTYIGQIYGIKGDLDSAISWYKKSISKNYIDYMAHWFLADAYLKQNNLQQATDEILIARILNRNNPRIKKSMTAILEKGKRKTEDWCFAPQMELTKVSDKQISVGINSKWTGYAVAKAVWTYEPGYPETMGVKSGTYSSLEEKECLVALMVGLENSKAKLKKDPQLQTLKEAFDKRQVDPYIIYEIMLPENPVIAYQLSEELIVSIKNYLLETRHKKS